MKRTIAVIMIILLFLCASSALAEEAEAVNLWCLELISAGEAVDSLTTAVPEEADAAEIKIALIDSGIRESDPRIDKEKILEGKNYVFEEAGTNDLLGHGTAVTSIILGAALEDMKIASIAEHISVVPLVCFSRYPSGVLANSGMDGLCKAIVDAVELYGCRIINISSGMDKESPVLKEAIDYAENKGVIIISAVGNSNAGAPEKVFYPAAYETVIGVGSVNGEGQVSAFSQRNASVFVSAPGDNVEVAAPSEKKKFKKVSGTSYAAAYVTSFAAFLLSEYPDMTPDEFRQILKDSSKDLGEPGYDIAYGWGLIDVKAALAKAEKILVPASYFFNPYSNILKCSTICPFRSKSGYQIHHSKVIPRIAKIKCRDRSSTLISSLSSPWRTPLSNISEIN